MLVDDNQDILYTYEAFLDEEEFYHVVTFTDPQEALMYFAQLDPHPRFDNLGYTNAQIQRTATLLQTKSNR